MSANVSEQGRWTGRARVALTAAAAVIVMVALALLSWGAAPAQAAGLEATDLQTEYATNPLGIDALLPRLSWKNESDERGQAQTSYRVQVAASPEALTSGGPLVWDSGKTSSARSNQVAYGGTALQSRQRYFWRVMAWDKDDQPSPWSSAAWWEMGLLNPADWTGNWIGLDPPPNPTFNNFTLDIELTPTNAAMGIFFRSNGTTNNYMWQLIGVGAGAPILRKHQWVNGTVTVLGNVSLSSYIPAGSFFNNRHHVRIIANGNQILTYINEQLVDTTVSSSHTTGSIGFRANVNDSGFGTERATIHSVKVTQGTSTVFEDDFSINLGHWSGNVNYVPGGGDIQGTTNVFLTAPYGKVAPMLRKDFQVTGEVESARLYVAGLAYADVSMNGDAVGDHRMDPVFVDYSKRAMYVTHDVTGQLEQGANTLGAMLGRGFYGMTSASVWDWHVANWWDDPKMRLQLEIKYTSGQTQTVISDGTWQADQSPLLSDSQYSGEIYDARREQPGWDSPGFDATSWESADVVNSPGVPLQAQNMEPIRVGEILEPVSVTEPVPGSYVVDFGQNIAGWIDVEFEGAAGDQVVMRYGEKLRPNGTVNNDDVLNHVSEDYQVDRFVLKGGVPVRYQSRFSYKGFQYVQFDGLSAPPELSSMVAKAVRTDLPDIGGFDSSNELFNKIHDGTRWAIRNNYHGMPTDTPMFEKNGWTADGQVMALSSMHNFHMPRAYGKWMQDMKDGQIANGRIPVIAPTHGWGNTWVAPEWSSTYVILAWDMFSQYGDRRVLANHYDAMRNYVNHEFGRLNSTTGLSTSSLGDWASPGNAQSSGPEGGALTSTAFVWKAHQLMGRIASELGNTGDAATFNTRANTILGNFNTAFLNTSTNVYSTPASAQYRQTSNILPLAWGMVPVANEAGVVNNLVNDIAVTRSNHLNTGVIGTKHLLRVLTKYGHEELANTVANQRTYPSWGLWWDNGATTPFEFWEVGSRSRGHMFLGTIVDWFYTDVAGLDTEGIGAERDLVVKPTLLSGLDDAEAWTETVWGPARSGWARISDDVVKYEVEVPVGTTATVALPAAELEDVSENGGYATDAEGVVAAEMSAGRAVLQVGSGDYEFVVDPEFEPDTEAPTTNVDTSGLLFGTYVTDRNPSWSFLASELDATSECSMNDSPFVACTSPWSAGIQLADGVHQLRIRSTDLAGNVESPGGAVGFIVDTTAQVTISGSTLKADKKRKKATLTLVCPAGEAPGGCTVSAIVLKTAKKLQLVKGKGKKKIHTIAKVSGSKTITPGGTLKLQVKLTSAGKKLLGNSKSVKGKLALRVSDSLGNTANVARSMTLKR